MRAHRVPVAAATTLAPFLVVFGCGSKADPGKEALSAFREFVVHTFSERVGDSVCSFRSDVRATNAVEQPFEGLLHVEASYIRNDGTVSDASTKFDLVFDRTSDGWNCSETRSTAAQEVNVLGGADACSFAERRCRITPERQREAEKGALVKPLWPQIAKLARRAYDENGSYPIGTTPLTPTTPCCANPNHRCSPDDRAWSASIWQQLGFRLEEPTSLQLSYTSSDGKTFTALGVGDPNCDGHTRTFEVRGSLTATGNPTFEFNERRAGAPTAAPITR